MPDRHSAPHPPERTLLVEGWRGINHSYALLNQYQLLEFLKIDGLRVLHRDLPFAFPHWSRTLNDPGFAAEDMARIDAVPAPGDVPVDAVLRICSPFRAGDTDDRRRLVTFMITELGLTSGSFHGLAARSPLFTRGDNRIVTSTAWSRDRIVEWGFDADCVDIVPLGVNTAVFHPVSPEERQANRAALGIAEDETVFVNVGIPAWNKGVDVLLRAFAALRRAGRRVRLIVKDQRDVYGVSIEQLIRTWAPTCPDLVRDDTITAISVVGATMPRDQLRLLYGIADAYVSPYRAEGFNLPVLEAIACGTPVIVTAGGATDDFCTDDVACQVPGVAGSREDVEPGTIARFIEPDLSSTIDAMDAFVRNAGIDRHRLAAGRDAVLARCSWPAAARALARITVGLPAANEVQAPVVAGQPARLRDAA